MQDPPRGGLSWEPHPARRKISTLWCHVGGTESKALLLLSCGLAPRSRPGQSGCTGRASQRLGWAPGLDSTLSRVDQGTGLGWPLGRLLAPPPTAPRTQIKPRVTRTHKPKARPPPRAPVGPHLLSRVSLPRQSRDREEGSPAAAQGLTCTESPWLFLCETRASGIWVLLGCWRLPCTRSSVRSQGVPTADGTKRTH